MAALQWLVSARRLPRHWWVLGLMVLGTLCLFFKLGASDFGPYDQWLNFHSSVVITRPGAGYNYLPEFHPSPGRPGGGYFDLYSYHFDRDGLFGYVQFDAPHWPGGDPGLGANNPIPPQITRHSIYSVNPVLPLGVLMGGWAVWTAMLARHRMQCSSKAGGFEVVVSQP